MTRTAWPSANGSGSGLVPIAVKPAATRLMFSISSSRIGTGRAPNRTTVAMPGTDRTSCSSVSAKRAKT
jgi:hypothetical protein